MFVVGTNMATLGYCMASLPFEKGKDNVFMLMEEGTTLATALLFIAIYVDYEREDIASMIITLQSAVVIVSMVIEVAHLFSRLCKMIENRRENKQSTSAVQAAAAHTNQESIE